ncbi:GNAT family N-acetyltransferase [uncultured Maritalea sp.]|uniref:GNAT family N-acetyltransferase n=1 Tax=uncultured Maritalea sp. TaxID=757249 RepID=UPI00260DC464|nr:GNAT family N-acetyltransferase [uncultured Maritalea sp.]
MAWSIKILSHENVGLLEHVAEDVFDYEICGEYVAAYLKQPNHQLIVALSDDQVVGQIRAMVHFQPDEAPTLYIDNLGVAINYQRLGIATALFEQIVQWGKSLGCTTYWVATECDNDEGNHFYKALGLAPEKMYYYEGET